MLSKLLAGDAAGATNALSVGAQLKASKELRMSNWTRRIIFFIYFSPASSLSISFSEDQHRWSGSPGFVLSIDVRLTLITASPLPPG
jgi:hypothetical protein